MGLFYQKKNDFGEEDGRTAQFNDFLITPPAAEGAEPEQQKAKEEENPKTLEEEMNKGKDEQQ